MKYLTQLALSIFCVAVILAVGCRNPDDGYVQAPSPSPDLPGAPLIPEIAVLRPYFQTTLGNVDVGSAVGTAFAVELNGSDSPIVLTSLTVLGPASGLTRQAQAAEVSEIFTTCTLGSAFGGFDGVISAAMFVGVPPSQRQHSAIVTGQDANGNITYDFDDRSITHQGTRGAPVLNKKGEVVAIHLGGTKSDGKLTGFANPTSRFLKYLEMAVSSSKK